MQKIVLILVGLAFLAVGFFLASNARFAEWGLTHGRGRVWAAMLGHDRAMKLTRFFFGPAVILLGLAGIAAAFIPPSPTTPSGATDRALPSQSR